MASYRTPKGTYNRNTGDWYYRKTLSVGAERHGPYTFPPYNYYFFQLLNSDTRGIPLHIHGLSALEDGLGLMVWTLQQGVKGSLERSAVPIFAQQGETYQADLYVQHITTPNEFEDNLIPVQGFLGAYFGTGPFFAGYPLWVIPAGWSIGIIAVDGNVDQGVNFWFTPLPD